MQNDSRKVSHSRPAMRARGGRSSWAAVGLSVGGVLAPPEVAEVAAGPARADPIVSGAIRSVLMRH